MFGDCIPPYLFIDASNEGYEEEEGDYEEEEEHFDNCTNQGKLIPCMLLLMQAILVQDTIATLFLCLGNLINPQVLPCKLLPFYLSKSFIVDLCLSINLLQVCQRLSLATQT